MKIALAQLDLEVGAFQANVEKIKKAYYDACERGCRILITPEMGICGYPPHDLLHRPEMFDRNERALGELLVLTRDQRCALIVGHVARNTAPVGRSAVNQVSVLENGQVAFSQAKTLLPTYDVFDEARYFEPSHAVNLWKCDGHRIALAICEDLWARDSTLGRQLYGRDPLKDYAAKGAELVLSLSASPYEMKKRERREKIHAEVARELGVPVIYVNQVGATDEILFDGASFAVDSEGRLIGRLPAFQTAFGVIDVTLKSDSASQLNWVKPNQIDREDRAPDELEVLNRALVTGIREYFSKTGFSKAVLGLSGGIDSAVVAVLAVQALGSKNVLGVAMPSQYSSGHSLADAEALARNLGIKLEVRPIKFTFATISRELAENRGVLRSVALENLQSRLRGMILMTLSNHDGSLVLTTGNKSELATGYCTLYGDMVGALCPLGDLLKTRVYELARFLNTKLGQVIPQSSLVKPPSAELKPGQVDQDTLPPYEMLDPMLEDYLEHNVPVEKIEKKHAGADVKLPKTWIRDVLRMVEINEFKRRQAAAVLKVTSKAFGVGRRIPLAKIWDQGS